MGPSSATDQRLTRWNSGSIAGLVILALSLGAFSMTYRFAQVPPMLSQNIPPTFFPRIILAAAGFMSALLLVRGLARPQPALPPVPAVVYWTAAWIGAGTLLLSRLGMLPVIFLLACLLPALWGERRWGRVAIFAVTLSASIYVLFSQILGLRLPLGLLERVP